jgi:DNA (cytosine-5)-methyltransferase 3A
MNQLELFTPTKIKNSINILSLFDGMSCGQIALNRIGIKYDNYYSSEIDKFAIAVTQHHYPNTIQLGDINNWPDWKLPKIDLIMGGSPCQGFSFAGKQLNFNDSRSKLFFKFVEILECHKPKYFLLENVRMKKEYQNVITEILGVEPILINSALVSAQNRNRLYWTNIPNVIQPIDRGIVLKDILVKEVSECIKVSKKGTYKKFQNKASCLSGGAHSGGNHSDMDIIGIREKSKSVRVGGRKPPLGSKQEWDSIYQSKCIQIGEANLKGHDSIKRVYSPEGKSPTLTNCMGGNREPKVEIIQTPRGVNKGGIKAKNGKTPVLTSSKWEYNNHLCKDGLKWRRLTPIECERLQTVPDNYTLVPWKNREMSNSQRYKMLGNGWTVDVIAHIFKNMVFD